MWLRLPAVSDSYARSEWTVPSTCWMKSLGLRVLSSSLVVDMMELMRVLYSEGRALTRMVIYWWSSSFPPAVSYSAFSLQIASRAVKVSFRTVQRNGVQSGV